LTFKGIPMNALEALAQWTTVVADTADLNALAQYRPQEATTNPSLVLKAAQATENAQKIQSTLAKHAHSTPEQKADAVLVAFAKGIADVIPGRVSMELDARLSFDTPAMVLRAEQLLNLAKAEGLEANRVLIKLAATWEGIQAAKALEQQGVHCNLTLVFSLVQAQACADAQVTLISPFVGRVGDWYQKNQVPWPQQDNVTGEVSQALPNSQNPNNAQALLPTSPHATAKNTAQDPGVVLVSRIFNAYKAQGVQTQIMGASFRNATQVLQLAGCDLLTIGSSILGDLAALDAEQLSQPALVSAGVLPNQTPWVHHNAASFHWALNEDAMASDKLAEGIRWFARDGRALDALLQEFSA
jgi:transaldolase